MANPFRVFRRHQRVLIASLGLMAMISFVFLPQCGTGGGGDGAMRDTDVVTTTRFGNLRESQIQRLQRDRSLVLNFLRHGKEMAARSLPAASQNDFRAYMLMRMPEFLGEATEENVVNMWLLAQRGAELGVAVGDDAVINFVKQQTDDRLGDRQVREILQQLGSSDIQLLETLRRELVAVQVLQMHQTSLVASTPAQRYEAFCRLNRQAAVELAALSVDKFLGQVPEPAEQAVAELFAEHKDQLQQPGSPEPGFREPYRATIEYIRADLDKFVDAKSVTDAEIEKYYNENKDNYRQPELPALDEKKASEPEKKAAEPEKKAAEPVKAEAKPDVKKAEPKKDAAPEAKKAEPAPAKKADEPQAEKKAEEKKAPPAGDKKTSAAGTASPFRFASYAEDKAVKPAEAKPAAAKPAEAKPAAAQPAEQKPAAAKPAEAKPVAEKPAAAKPADVKPAEAKPAAQGGPSLELPKLSQPAAPAPKYLPLEKVKEEIRGLVARRNAAKKMQAVLEPLRNELKQNAVKAARNAKGDALAAEFAKVDVKALAARAKLELSRWELISAREVEASELGQATVQGNMPFMQYAFASEGLGRVAVAEDLRGNKYLFWKINEKKEHVPSLTDVGVRDKVVLAWKRIQARALAVKEAERLAEQARAAKKPLKDALQGVAGVAVTQPRPFTWLTMGMASMYQQAPPQLGDVEGVVMPGQEFMRAVFGLKPGEVGVAANSPQTTVYVVRLDSASPDAAVLWERFTNEDFHRYAGVLRIEQQDLFANWAKELREYAGFRWQRSPDRPIARSEEPVQGRQPKPYENELD